MKRSFGDTALGQVHFVDAGPPSPTPIVLLHQTPRSIDEFRDVIPLLARTRRVLAIDTPGYGCSDPVPEQPTIAQYAAAVASVLDQAGVETACMAGHHTGGVIAAEMAAAHPHRVAKVVISGPVFVDAEVRAALGKLFVQWRVQPDGSHLLEKWRKLQGWTKDPALVQRLALDSFRAGERSEQGHLAVAAYRMEDRLPLVRCPALLIYGSRDPFADPAKCRPLREAFREVREVTLEGSVFLPEEAPGAFAAAVLEFHASSAAEAFLE